ncbi:MAG TPA: AraC family transcriptional regulator, partial [Novosphingobium sp.]|nr:AraC family transcriptional regulator [Novosphingobium sp.]
DCSLVRFDLAGGAQLDIDEMIHDDIVFLAFEGCGWWSRNGDGARQERPGDIIMRRAGEHFAIRSEWIAQTGGVCREIHLSHRRLAEWAELEASPVARLDFGDGLLADGALSRQLLALHARFEQNHEELEAFEGIAAWMEQLAARLSPAAGQARMGACQRGIARVVDYLRTHYAENVALEDLAGVAGMNRFVLLRQFRDQVGVTPHQYLRIRRVVMAKLHLRAGMPLAEIASACGFFDQSHMTREFKRRTGLTPTAFIPKSPRRGILPQYPRGGALCEEA